MTDPICPHRQIAVALIRDRDSRLLWIWNTRWHAYALPMKRLNGRESGSEGIRTRAAQAAWEAVGVPVSPGVDWMDVSVLARSGADGEVKLYDYHVVDITVQDSHAPRMSSRRSHLWLTPTESLSGRHGPVSWSCKDLLRRLIENGCLAARTRDVLMLIIRRPAIRGHRFLLRRDEHWGYTLGSKRLQDVLGRQGTARGESTFELARAICRDQFGFAVDDRDAVKIAALPTVAAHMDSMSSGEPTFYRYRVLELRLSGALRGARGAAVRWAADSDVLAGHFGSMDSEGESIISATVGLVLCDLEAIPCPFTAAGEQS